MSRTADDPMHPSSDEPGQFASALIDAVKSRFPSGLTVLDFFAAMEHSLPPFSDSFACGTYLGIDPIEYRPSMWLAVVAKWRYECARAMVARKAVEDGGGLEEVRRYT